MSSKSPWSTKNNCLCPCNHSPIRPHQPRAPLSICAQSRINALGATLHPFYVALIPLRHFPISKSVIKARQRRGLPTSAPPRSHHHRRNHKDYRKRHQGCRQYHPWPAHLDMLLRNLHSAMNLSCIGACANRIGHTARHVVHDVWEAFSPEHRPCRIVAWS